MGEGRGREAVGESRWEKGVKRHGYPIFYLTAYVPKRERTRPHKAAVSA